MEPGIGLEGSIRKDTVELRVAIPAADPPDNIAHAKSTAAFQAACVLM
jgi:hypothetical protein